MVSQSSTLGHPHVTYWRYWQLDKIPFSGDYSQPLFRGATVEEAIARIEFLIANRRSVGSLIGSSGVGKSSLLRHCGANPPDGPEVPNVQIVRTSVLGMQPGELLTSLASRLAGCRSATTSLRAWSILCDYFRAADREGTQTALLIDDTESGSAGAEADLSRLLSMAFPLTVIFAVETEMAGAISPGLVERVELQIELPGWEIMQTTEFLAWTFRRVGRCEPIFTDSAVERIHSLSHGRPRRIVQLADLALVAGAVAQMNAIDADCIDQVAWELPKMQAA